MLCYLTTLYLIPIIIVFTAMDHFGKHVLYHEPRTECTSDPSSNLLFLIILFLQDNEFLLALVLTVKEG